MNLHQTSGAFSDKTAFGRDKIAHYKWEPVRGHGQLMSINKTDLMVDHQYQRDFKNPKTIEIAKNFNWIAFGSIAVARRPDGSLWVIDGQHRLGAALKRSDVTNVPCVVYDVDSIQDEAGGFLDINVGRKPLTSLDTHRALVVRGDESSCLLEKLARDHGYQLSSTKAVGRIKCVAVCRRLLLAKRESFLAMFPIAAELCRERGFDERVIEALVYIHDKTEGAISKPVWRKAIADLGYDGIRAATDRAAAFYQRGGSKVWALGLAEALNKGRRTNRIEID